MLRNYATYELRAALHQGAGSLTKPITLRYESLNCEDLTSYESWLFHHTNSDTKHTVDHFFPDVNEDDEPLSIDINYGFVTLYPGEKVEKDVAIWSNLWKGLHVGADFDLLMHHATIGWWDWGTIEDFAGRKVTKHDTRDDKVILDIPSSNSIRAKFVNKDLMSN